MASSLPERRLTRWSSGRRWSMVLGAPGNFLTDWSNWWPGRPLPLGGLAAPRSMVGTRQPL